MSHENRKFLIFNVSELHIVDFSQVLETSSNTVRKSTDGQKTFIKWNSQVEPSFVNSLTTKEGPYNYEEFLNILSTSEWISPMPEHMI
jgi:hypothetical protein